MDHFYYTYSELQIIKSRKLLSDIDKRRSQWHNKCDQNVDWKLSIFLDRQSDLSIVYLKFIRTDIDINTSDCPSYHSAISLFAPYTSAEGSDVTLLSDHRCWKLGKFQLGKNFCNREQHFIITSREWKLARKRKRRLIARHEQRTGPVSYGTDQQYNICSRATSLTKLNCWRPRYCGWVPSPELDQWRGFSSSTKLTFDFCFWLAACRNV